MSSSSKQGKGNKFAHLPLSTSGAQKTTLTVRFILLSMKTWSADFM
jgi:hypothetical protein